jgi:hypothetical protein
MRTAFLTALGFLIVSGIIGAVAAWQELQRYDNDQWPDTHQPSHVRKVRPGQHGWTELETRFYDQDQPT